MNIARLLLSDQTLTVPNVLKAAGFLALFGMAVNGLFELWKLVPSLFPFVKALLAMHWQDLLIDLAPSAVLAFWMWRSILIPLKRSTAGNSGGALSSFAPPKQHRGVIVVLSTPRDSLEEIRTRIESASNPEALYPLPGIGQTFRGLYYHKEVLQRVWPLSTEKSEPYRVCVEQFVKKFIPKASLCEKERCKLEGVHGNSMDVIQSAKARLAHIYSKECLNTEAIQLQPSDIIVDVTGGSKDITIGLALGALDSTTDVQYVEQNNYNVITLPLTPVIVLDKVARFLDELYLKQHAEKCS
jgi:hypothetical protein